MSSFSDLEKRQDLKLGYACNNNCLFCILGDKRRFAARSTREIEKEIIKAHDSGVEKLLLTGGEPTIRKDILRIVSFANSLGFKTIYIESNGRLFAYRKFAEDIIKKGANAFSISVPAPNRYIFAKQSRTSEGAFDQVLRGLKNLSDLNQEIEINCTITKLNYKYLSGIVRLLFKFKIKSINFPFVNPDGNAWKYKKIIVSSLSEVKPHLKKAIDLAQKNGIYVTTEMIPFCFVPGNEKCVMEQYKKNMTINAPDYFDEDFDRTRLSSRVKGKQCKECKYNSMCEGVTENYAKIYGVSELKPVRAK